MNTRTIKRILVATDGGTSSQHAVELGLELAAVEKAEVTFLHVVPPVEFAGGRVSRPVPRRLRSVGDEALNDATFAAETRGVRFQRDLIAGDIGDSIVAVADAISADLVVVGERTRRLRVGSSVSRWVARHSTRPVLLARGPVESRVAA